MQNSFSKAAHWKRQWQSHLQDPGLRLLIGAVSLSVVFGGASYYLNDQKAKRTPVAFSEFGKTARSFEQKGEPVPPLTHFYSVTNDIVMQVFEAGNIANERSFFADAFPSELEFKMNKGVRVHTQISKRAVELPPVADAALTSLDKFVQTIRELPPVIAAFDASWNDRHTDVTHTEYDTRQVCDSQNNCHTETTSREVYDYTIHKYTYHPDEGRKADALLSGFLARHADLNIEERLVQATSTEADNEYAIEKSMPEIFKGKIAAGDDALAFANSWATGSNLVKYQPVIASGHMGLKDSQPHWNAALNTASSKTYRTYSHSDSGPKEFQIARTAFNQAVTVYDSARRVVDGVEIARDGVPQLDAKIREYIGVALDGKPGDAGALKKEVIEQARNIYEKNFENGLDVRPFKWGEVAFFAVLGLIAGGAGVAVYDRSRYGNPGL